MTATSKLGLELLQNAAANQTLANTTFAQLNQLVQPAVVDKDLSAPPSSPADEALYIVAASPSGAWAGRAGQLAYWLNATNSWQFVPPQNGFMVKVLDESKRYEFNGTAWVEFSSGGAGSGSLAVDGSNRMTGPVNEAVTVGGGSQSGTTFTFPDTTNTVFPSASGTIGTLVTNVPSTNPIGIIRRMTFVSSITLQYSANRMELPGKADIITQPGDTAEFQNEGGINWRCLRYTRVNGTAVIGFSGGPLSSALNEAAIVAIASAAAPDIGVDLANTFNITGTATIASFATAPSGIRRTLIFADILTLTHNATSLILLGNANVVTAAGDIAEFLSLGSGNWKMARYTRAAVAP